MKILPLARKYLMNTSLHGVRIIVQKDCHWSERVLWTVLSIFSWSGAAFLIHASWESYQNNAVTSVVETNYVQANVSFPSISVCEDDNLIRVYNHAVQMFGEHHDTNLDEVLRELTFFKGSAYYMHEFCTMGELNCPVGNFSQIVNRIRSSCKDMVKSCSWNGVPFDCCKHFLPTDTELGPCFTFGGRFERQLLREGDPDFIDTVANRQSMLPILRIELEGNALIYPHSEVDLPFYNVPSSNILGPEINFIKRYSLTVLDVDNPVELGSLTMSQRQCRLPEENYLKSAKYYSFDACIVDCRREAQLKLCNCTSHFMPKSDQAQHCDLEGILCLNKNYGRLMVTNSRRYFNGLPCDCLPGCYDPEYNILSVSTEYKFPMTDTSVTEIRLAQFPTTQARRKVVQSPLTFLVSVGSTAALLIGASFLSVAEFFYFLFRTYTDEELQSDGSTTSHESAQSHVSPADPEILPGPSFISYESEVIKKPPPTKVTLVQKLFLKVKL